MAGTRTEAGSEGGGGPAPISAPSLTPLSRGSAAVSNRFTVGKAKLNRKRGTATLTITVPGPGTLALDGKGVVKQPRKVGAGTIELAVRVKGKWRTSLNRKGSVKVRVTITFTPEGGSPASQQKTVKLKKRLRAGKSSGSGS